MKLLKVLYLSILLVLPLQVMGNTNNHIPLDTVEITTFLDTVYSPNLPSIELKIGTYHNFYGSTTVGYKLILRGEELNVNGALLYKTDPESNHDNPIHLLSPFHLHIGDSTDNKRIDHIYVKHKFPHSCYFSKDDSLIILTDKGNLTLYLNEEKWAAAKYSPILESLHNEISEAENNLEETRHKSYVIIAIIIVIVLTLGVIVLVYLRRQQRIKTEQMNKLLMLLSENEMTTRQLKHKISGLMRNCFDTINKLCYEYFEKADTSFLKKSIYTKVEEEIEQLKSPEQLSQFEKDLNEYCDDIIQRAEMQIPKLSDAEKTLLIYLYSGLSARTICVLMDVQLKTFYMRRLRLKNKIESSDAPDKDWFVANM
ncbi:MAG: hypothetical protein K2M19_03840 [Muribaculaceae bacterium]|nr:hypothetical protein [Muribaculaceae bacterium]